MDICLSKTHWVQPFEFVKMRAVVNRMVKIETVNEHGDARLLDWRF
jgi:hypothetical protein